MENTDLIQQLYIAYYGRPADPSGLIFWSEQLDQNNGDLDAIMDAFGTSEEFDNRFGELSARDLVNNLYQQVFGRNADEEGLSFYSELLSSGQSTLAKLATDVVLGAQNSDVTTIQNRVEVAKDITQNVEERGLRYGFEEIDAAGQVVANVTASTNVSDYIQSTVEALLDTLPATDDRPVPSPESESTKIELDEGNIVFSFSENSTLENDGSAVTISQADIDGFVAAKNGLLASQSSNFGDIITLEAGRDTLELVTIEFVGSSQLRDLGTTVGYDEWIDFALYNGDLVTPDLLDVSEAEFFGGENEIENYFGYEWPLEGPQTISRTDGQSFTLEIEVLDALGIANLDAFMTEYIA